MKGLLHNKGRWHHLFVCGIAVLFAAGLLMAADVEVTKRTDGTEVTFDRINGIKTIKNRDGSKTVVDLKGKTPYGIAIENTERIFYKNENISAALHYDSSKSDDMLQDEILVFYDSLFAALKNSYLKKTVTASFQVKISYCRFCEHSFCYKKDQQVSVEIESGGRIIPVYSFSGLNLNDKIKREESISQIVAKVSSLAATF